MENVTFEAVRKGGHKQWRALLPLWLDFCAELGTESEITPARDLKRRVNIQGSRPDMHFDILRVGKRKSPIGFAHYAVDKGTVGGLIDPDGGVFLAYYIVPEYRRKGYGRRMFLHCAETLYRDGAAYLYCCPDPVTGEPFWRAMGFADSGVMDPDEHLPIYTKPRPDPASIVCRAMCVEDLHPHMMDAFERYQEITREYRKRRLGRGWRIVKLRKPRTEENWPAKGKTRLIRNFFLDGVYFRRHYPGEPLVFAAFLGGRMVGFAIWDHYWGEEKGYAILLRLFVSLECRRMGLGRQLFALCAEAARAEGAQKLFISAEPAVETQEFYRSISCTIAKKRIYGNKKDVPLEYRL